MNKWISMEDGDWPEQYVEVLFFCSGNIYMGYCDWEYNFILINDVPHIKPTHWMPLPPMPELRRKDMEEKNFKNRFREKLDSAVEALDKCNDLVWTEFNRLLRAGDKEKADRFFEKIVQPSNNNFNRMLDLQKRVYKKRI